MQVCRTCTVTLEAYKNLVEVQTIKILSWTRRQWKKPSPISYSAHGYYGVLDRLSARERRCYIRTCRNGKTTIAETIEGFCPARYICPMRLLSREIITIFDPVNHIPVNSEPASEHTDQRWIKIKRPVIMTGANSPWRHLISTSMRSRILRGFAPDEGEQRLFIVDDFGSSRWTPRTSWTGVIVPLERRTDFMTLHTGMKFDIPFDQIVIFATNLEPKNLVDEAFLRRYGTNQDRSSDRRWIWGDFHKGNEATAYLQAGYAWLPHQALL